MHVWLAPRTCVVLGDFLFRSETDASNMLPGFAYVACNHDLAVVWAFKVQSGTVSGASKRKLTGLSAWTPGFAGPVDLSMKRRIKERLSLVPCDF